MTIQETDKGLDLYYVLLLRPVTHPFERNWVFEFEDHRTGALFQSNKMINRVGVLKNVPSDRSHRQYMWIIEDSDGVGRCGVSGGRWSVFTILKRIYLEEPEYLIESENFQNWVERFGLSKEKTYQSIDTVLETMRCSATWSVTEALKFHNLFFDKKASVYPIWQGDPEQIAKEGGRPSPTLEEWRSVYPHRKDIISRI